MLASQNHLFGNSTSFSRGVLKRRIYAHPYAYASNAIYAFFGIKIRNVRNDRNHTSSDFHFVRNVRNIRNVRTILRTLRTKEKSGEVWFRTLRTLRKIVPTMRILRYLRTRTGVRIYAVLGTPIFWAIFYEFAAHILRRPKFEG